MLKKKAVVKGANVKPALFIIMLIVIGGMAVFMSGGFAFSAVDIDDPDDDLSVDRFEIRMWFEWEDDRHDLVFGDQYVWIRCEDFVRGDMLDRVELMYPSLIYRGINEYVWNEGDKVRLEFDMSGDPDWEFHDGSGRVLDHIVATAGTDLMVHFYQPHLQWEYGILHVEWW